MTKGPLFGKLHPLTVMNTITQNSLQVQGTTTTYYEPKGPAKKGGGLRGQITESSDASRHRLIKKVASIDWFQVKELNWFVNFITLTTPREYWHKTGEVYLALRRTLDFLESIGIEACIVKKEYGSKSGMLHYHIMAMGEDIRKKEKLLRRKWTQHLGYKDKGGKDVIVDIDRRDSNDPAVIGKYICKYMVKAAYEGKINENACLTSETSASEASGVREGDATTLSKSHNVDCESVEQVSEYYNGRRFWYVRGEDKIPKYEVTEILSINEEYIRRLAKRIRRIFRKWRKVQQLKQFQRENPLFIRHGIPEKMLKLWVKSPAYRFLIRPGGYSLIASEEVMNTIIRAAMIQEKCAYTLKIGDEQLDCYSI